MSNFSISQVFSALLENFVTVIKFEIVVSRLFQFGRVTDLSFGTKFKADKQFFPFHTVFLTHLDIFLPFPSNCRLSSASSFNLEESKICRFGKG